MSKIDPTKLSSTIKLDRRSTILLQAARSQTECLDEKHISGLEDPGIDALRGSFGTFGSMIRARSVRRSSQRSSRFGSGGLPPGAMAPYLNTSGLPHHHDSSSFVLEGLRRHQLYDAPVPRNDTDTGSIHTSSIHSQSQQQQHKRPTVKFDSQDVVHSYSRPGTGDSKAIHEHRAAIGSPGPMQTQSFQQHQSQSIVYPPIQPPKSPLSTPAPTRSLSQQQQHRSSSPLPPAPLEGTLLEIESPAEDTPMSVATDRAVLADDFSHPMLASMSSTSASALLLAPTAGGRDVVAPHLERNVVTGLQSAPPTIYKGFRSPSGPSSPSSPTKPRRKEILTHTPRGGDQVDDGSTRISGVSGTLLSFPSITDSGRSEEIWDEEELERQKERAREKDRERSVITNTSSRDKGKEKSNRHNHHVRRYPKGDGDDDREESISLWRRESEDDVGTSSVEGEETGSDEMSQSPLKEGGIRLVLPGKKNDVS